MRERRRNEDPVFGAESEMLDFHRSGAHQDVVAMEHALRLARRARSKEQLRDSVWLGASRVERRCVDADGLERLFQANPVHRTVRVVGGGHRMCAPPARRYDDVFETQRQIAAEDRGLAQQRRDFAGGISAACFVGYDENARARAAQAERELALAENRHQRAADRADAQRGKRDDDELDAVRKLIRNAFARPHAEIEQQRRHALDSIEQLLPRHAHVGAVASLDDGELGGPLASLQAKQLVERQFGRAIRLEHRPVECRRRWRVRSRGRSLTDIGTPMARIASRNRGYEMRYAFG